MFKREKYGNKKTNGRASRLENAVFEYLKRRETLGEISDIKEQQSIVLQGGKRVTRITWRVDFSYTVNATKALEYCEAKGLETDVYKLKLKMFRANPPASLEIFKGRYRNRNLEIYLHERINK